MVTYREAVNVLKKYITKPILSVSQTPSKYIFNVNTSLNIEDYVLTIDKKTGEFSSMTLLEYADAVDKNQISEIEEEP